MGDAVYLLRDHPVERTGPDRAWVWREATADRIEPTYGRVRLRQCETVRPAAAATERRTALQAQARLLAALARGPGLPRLMAVHEQEHDTTIVTAHPRGSPWADLFDPGTSVPDERSAAAAIASAVEVCAALIEIHRHGHAHRALTPGGIFVDRGCRAQLLDIGLAGMPTTPPEGDPVYRAPEQRREPFATGARTDVFQVAALLYHTVTGHPPGTATTPPVRATIPGFPPRLDDTLRRALASDPRARPDIAGLQRVLQQSRQELSGR